MKNWGFFRQYLLDTVGAKKIIIDPAINNTRAIRAYEKTGFQKVKKIQGHEPHEGKITDAWLMVYEKSPDTSMRNIKEYLNQLTKRIEEFLGDNLIGLYQFGSSSLNDFQSSSDLDVIGVVNEALKETEKNTLTTILDHKRLPCPASGLDFVIVTVDAIKNIVAEPFYNYRFSTGGSWKVEPENGGKSKEMLMHFEICARSGVRLIGPDPDSLFITIERKLLIEALIDGLQWHQTEILDSFHDPYGQYSVLNACRALAFAKTDEFLSKSKGAEWYLKIEPSNKLVKNALKMRKGGKKESPKKEQIEEFLKKVIQELMDTKL